mmetsp:Transcript_65922/g.132365  ORF Transcript_65922/g.132365 Transcript_65922/m.132365 type:complete len:117 (-) Transcript_65922:80-430(-)
MTTFAGSDGRLRGHRRSFERVKRLLATGSSPSLRALRHPRWLLVWCLAFCRRFASSTSALAAPPSPGLCWCSARSTSRLSVGYPARSYCLQVLLLGVLLRLAASLTIRGSQLCIHA